MTGPYLARNPILIGMLMAGDVAGFCVPSRSRPLAARPLNVLVANLAHLGDIINLLPVLQRLQASPDVAKVGFLAGPWTRSLLEKVKLADKIHCVEHWSLNRSNISLKDKLGRHFASRSAAVQEMRFEKYDVALDTYPYFGNSADTLWSAQIPVRIGFNSGGGGTFYSQPVPFDPSISVQANQYGLLDHVLGKQDDHWPENPGLLLDPDVEKRASAIGDYIVFHVGRGEAHRSWPEQNWIALARRIASKGLKIVFTGEEAESEVSAGIRRAVPSLNMIGQLSFDGFTTILSRARGLVAVDTVAGHIAARFRVPTVVVQNGTIPSHLWRPTQPFVEGIRAPTECAPCNRSRGCPTMECIRSVSPESVEAALQELIEARFGTATLVRSVQQVGN
jgi:ADP-heptose:LPS heptosyltransferase